MNTLGEKIRYFRKLKGLSQEDLAYELDISLTAYSKIERNITDVNFSRLIQITKVLDISLIELLSVNENYKSLKQENEQLKNIISKKDQEIITLQNQLIQILKKK
ncbi:MAG: hypothetical protein VR77_00985 [Flavobacteriales bacterium BRH_c54]|nr:MAG: hypothetical protein VR77_00985 [Flavobacteriales bacterium BRH_c54]